MPPRGGGRGRGGGRLAPGLRPVSEDARISIADQLEGFQRSQDTGGSCSPFIVLQVHFAHTLLTTPAFLQQHSVSVLCTAWWGSTVGEMNVGLLSSLVHFITWLSLMII